MADGIERCKDPADPERCRSVARGSQCMMKAAPGAQNCPLHGGTSTVSKNNRKELYNLQLSKWRAKLLTLGSSSAILNIRDEIGVSRLCLQELLEKCNDGNELIIYEPNISRLTMNISKLVSECFKLESHMGQLLDKAALSAFAGKVIDIICTHVDDEDLRKTIAGEIVMAAQSAGTQDDETTESTGEEDL